MKFLSYLTQLLGINLINVINGAIGGMAWALYKKSKIIDTIRQIFFGGIVSAYVTPLIGNRLNSYTAFLSFTTGMLGMVALEFIYTWGMKKLKVLFGA